MNFLLCVEHSVFSLFLLKRRGNINIVYSLCLAYVVRGLRLPTNYFFFLPPTICGHMRLSHMLVLCVSVRYPSASRMLLDCICDSNLKKRQPTDCKSSEMKRTCVDKHVPFALLWHYCIARWVDLKQRQKKGQGGARRVTNDFHAGHRKCPMTAELK